MVKDRIKEVRQEVAKLNQTDFGKRIALSRSAICKIESGENSPSKQTLRLICKEFNVSYLWLKDGIGIREEESDHSTMARIDAIMTGENETAKNIFKAFSKLDDKEWELLAKLIKDISEEI